MGVCQGSACLKWRRAPFEMKCQEDCPSWLTVQSGLIREPTLRGHFSDMVGQEKSQIDVAKKDIDES